MRGRVCNTFCVNYCKVWRKINQNRTSILKFNAFVSLRTHWLIYETMYSHWKETTQVSCFNCAFRWFVNVLILNLFILLMWHYPTEDININNYCVRVLFSTTYTLVSEVVNLIPFSLLVKPTPTYTILTTKYDSAVIRDIYFHSS